MITINEQHLGDVATAEHARDVVRALAQRGFAVQYGDALHWVFESDDERVVFERAFDDALAECAQ